MQNGVWQEAQLQVKLCSTLQDSQVKLTVVIYVDKKISQVTTLDQGKQKYAFTGIALVETRRNLFYSGPVSGVKYFSKK